MRRAREYDEIVGVAVRGAEAGEFTQVVLTTVQGYQASTGMFTTVQLEEKVLTNDFVGRRRPLMERLRMAWRMVFE